MKEPMKIELSIEEVEDGYLSSGNFQGDDFLQLGAIEVLISKLQNKKREILNCIEKRSKNIDLDESEE